MNAKTFPTLHVASCMTGVGLCDGISFSTMQEIASHLLGAPIWTHELAHKVTTDLYRAEGLRQLPNMPTREEAEADWPAAAAKATAAYGDTVTLEEGTAGRQSSPIDTLAEMMPAEKIAVVVEV